MSIALRVALIAVSVLTCFFVLRRMRRAQMQIEDSIFWILFALILVVISIFPRIASVASEFLGIESPSNFVFLIFIFVLIVKLFTLSIELSQLKVKLKTLIQEYAIEKKKLEDERRAEAPSDKTE